MGVLAREIYEFIIGIPWSQVWPWIIFSIFIMAGWTFMAFVLESKSPTWMKYLIVLGGTALFGWILRGY